jgi:hypothetical protein
MQRIFIKKCPLFVVGSVCRLKRFTDDEEFKTELRKCLKQQSKDFYAAGFDAVVKRWDKCINAGRGYVDK